MYGALGNGRAQTGTSGVPLLNRREAVEGMEDMGKLFFRYARTMVAHLNDGMRALRRRLMTHTHFRFSALDGRVHGIAHDVFNRTAQRLRRAKHWTWLTANHADGGMAGACFEIA